MPVDTINNTLDTELEPGDTVLTSRAQQHILDDHPDDYDVVLANLHRIIAMPTYIGQSPRHNDSFELVKRIVSASGTEIVLAAVRLTRNEFGNYHIHSAYRLTEEKVTSRIKRGHLLFPKRKGP